MLLEQFKYPLKVRFEMHLNGSLCRLYRKKITQNDETKHVFCCVQQFAKQIWNVLLCWNDYVVSTNNMHDHSLKVPITQFLDSKAQPINLILICGWFAGFFPCAIRDAFASVGDRNSFLISDFQVLFMEFSFRVPQIRCKFCLHFFFFSMARFL